MREGIFTLVFLSLCQIETPSDTDGFETTGDVMEDSTTGFPSVCLDLEHPEEDPDCVEELENLCAMENEDSCEEISFLIPGDYKIQCAWASVFLMDPSCGIQGVSHECRPTVVHDDYACWHPCEDDEGWGPFSSVYLENQTLVDVGCSPEDTARVPLNTNFCTANGICLCRESLCGLK